MEIKLPGFVIPDPKLQHPAPLSPLTEDDEVELYENVANELPST